jgi:hypothetical protein
VRRVYEPATADNGAASWQAEHTMILVRAFGLSPAGTQGFKVSNSQQD